MRVAIVGGGIAGVSAAYELARQGIEFTLYEASPRLGGIVETVRRDGFVIECGPDSWVTEKPWARELAIESGLESEIIPSNDRQRRTYIVRGSELVPMPDGMRMMVPTEWEPLLASPLFSEKAKQAYQQELLRAEEFRASIPDADESVASFVRRHFGDEVTDTLAAPLLSGVFGGSVDRLSVRAVMPAFVKMEREHGSLITALQKSVRGSSGASVFTTLKSGLQTLIDRMAATLPSSSVRLSDPVAKVAQHGPKWSIEASSGAASFDAVIVAAPADATRRLLAPLDAEFDELLSMDASSAIIVAMAFDAERARTLRVPEGFGFLIPQKAVDASSEPSLLACTFVDQKFSHRVPEGAVLLRGFFGGDHAPLLMGASDAEIVSLAAKQLSTLLGALPEAAFTVVRRWPRSLPQYAVGHLERVARLEELVRRFPGLRLVGNAYHGVGLPDLIRDGRAAGHGVVPPSPLG